MANEINKVRDGAIIAAEINIIKEDTKRAVLSASIQIGQRLCEAKELVQFGDWEQWLYEKVDYSQSTANNLMKIYKEYGDGQINFLSNTSKSQTFGNLTYSQAIALFALPAEEREEFVKENPVEDMTTQQLRDAIKQAEKEKADALAEKEETNNKLVNTNKLLTLANDGKDKLEQALKKEQDAKTKADEKVKKLKLELTAAVKPNAVPPSPEELKKLRAEVKAEIEADYKKQSEQLTLEKKTAEDAAAEIEKNIKIS